MARETAGIGQQHRHIFWHRIRMCTKLNPGGFPVKQNAKLNPVFPQSRLYSWRNATMGSTFIALRAGM